MKDVLLRSMNDLSLYIEHLLLSHDCVVLPHFGAFITLASTATRVEDEALFLPPKRMVSFTTDVVEDDGLLVDAIQQSTRCSSTEAKRRVQKLILDLRGQLLTDGFVDFGSLGVLSQDEDGHLSFAPCMAGVVTPAYFGLDAVVFPLLSSRVSTKSKARRRKQLDEDSSDHITIRISKRALRNAVAWAAIVVLCVLFISPSEMMSGSSANQASIIPQETIATCVEKKTAPQPKANTAKPVTATAKPDCMEASEETEVQTKQESEPICEPVSEPVTEPVATNGYVIVLASAISEHNAASFAEKLQAKGYDNAQVMSSDKMRRVVLSGYSSESEAYSKAASLRALGGDFAGAWVMKVESE